MRPSDLGDRGSHATWHFGLPVAKFNGETAEQDMTSTYRSVRMSVMLSVVVLGCMPRGAFSETPGEIPKPWTYEGSMKLQEQQRQQDPQFQQRPGTPQNGRSAGGGVGAE